MIAHLEGKIFFRGSRFLIVDVNGVGYKVGASLETIRMYSKEGDPCRLFTYLHVRETALELYGFATMAELEFFEMLIGISGIGPKSALGILSVASLDSLKRAIGAGDMTYLTKVSGIGKRIAEKVIVELREKLAGAGTEETLGSTLSDALDALVSLGYSEREARDALRRVSGEAATLDMQVKEALKLLGRT